MYTEEEQRAAVEALVGGSIRRLYGASGNRQTGVTFSDMQDATAGLFLSKPKAPYALVGIGVARLAAQVLSMRNSITDCVSSARAMLRRVPTPTRLSDLSSAAAALDALSSSGRKTGIDVDSPGVQQFQAATDRFLATDGQLLVEDGDVVQAPDEAKAALATGFQTLVNTWADLEEKLGYLTNAAGDLESLALPASLSVTVLSKAKDSLQSEFTRLLGMSGTEQLKELRGTVLKVLAAKAAVGTYIGKPSSGLFVYPGGKIDVLVDAARPALPASVTTLAAPWTLYSNPQPPDFDSSETMLRLVVDGTQYTALMPEGFLAQLDGSMPGPYVLTAEASLDFNVDAVLLQTVYVPAGTWSAYDIMVLVTTKKLALVPVLPTLYFSLPKYQGLATVLPYSAQGNGIQLHSGFWSDYGVQVGDNVLVHTVEHPGGVLYYVMSLQGSIAYCDTVRLTTGVYVPAPLAATSGNYNVVVGVNPMPRFMLSPATSDDSLRQETRLALTGTLPTVLGVPVGVHVASYCTQADAVISFLERNSGLRLSGTPVLAVGKVWVPGTAGIYKTDPDQPNKVKHVASTWSGSVEPAELVTIVSPELASVLGTTGAYIYEVTSSEKPIYVGTARRVLSVVGNTVTLDWAYAGAGPLECTIEFGEDFAWNSGGNVLKVTSGANTGDYWTMRSDGTQQEWQTSYAERRQLTLIRPLPVYTSGGGLPMLLQAEYGNYCVRCTTKNTTREGSIQLQSVPGATAAEVLADDTSAHKNTCQWFSLQDTTGVENGDSLELYTTNPSTPSSSWEIDKVESAAVHVTTPVSCDFAGYYSDYETQLPCMRVRKRHVSSYSVLADALLYWVSSSVTSAAGKAGMTSVMSPINASTHASAEQVGNVVNVLVELDKMLAALRSLLGAYTPPEVSEVATLVQCYTEKGATRALEMLYYGRFSDFFGLTAETATVSGNLQQQVRQVLTVDLAQSRYGRQQTGQRVIYSASDTDIDATTSVDEPDGV